MVFAFLSVALNAAAQVAIKKTSINGFASIGELVKNPYLYATGLFYGLSIGLWFAALAKINLSVAYPLQALGYIVVSVAAIYIFNEKMSAINFAGLFLIFIGVLLTQVSR